jgi:hypothetical protein
VGTLAWHNIHSNNQLDRKFGMVMMVGTCMKLFSIKTVPAVDRIYMV